MKLSCLFGLGLIVASVAWLLRSGNKSVRVDPPQNPVKGPSKPPPVSVGHVPPQFICWHCNEMSVLPGPTEMGLKVFSCGHCNMDNQLNIIPKKANEFYVGHMVSVNRIANFL